jgi:uncharacterized phage-associated protein
MPARMISAFDVALWFCDQALEHNEYLQPQKLQRLLFLSQAYFALAYSNGKLMPAHFVADEMGPVEPNIFKSFTKGRPNVEGELFMPPEVEEFLLNIWRRFGHHSVEHLTRLVKKSPAYTNAFKKDPRAEITLTAMRLAFARAEKTPDLKQVVRPKVMRSQSGRAVAVTNWVPEKKVRSKGQGKKKNQAGETVEVQAWSPGTKPARRN